MKIIPHSHELTQCVMSADVWTQLVVVVSGGHSDLVNPKWQQQPLGYMAAILDLPSSSNLPIQQMDICCCKQMNILAFSNYSAPQVRRGENFNCDFSA